MLMTFYCLWPILVVPQLYELSGSTHSKRYISIDQNKFNQTDYSEITQDIDRWAPLKLSLWGKVNTLKMNLIP